MKKASDRKSPPRWKMSLEGWAWLGLIVIWFVLGFVAWTWTMIHGWKNDTLQGWKIDGLMLFVGLVAGPLALGMVIQAAWGKRRQDA